MAVRVVELSIISNGSGGGGGGEGIMRSLPGHGIKFESSANNFMVPEMKFRALNFQFFQKIFVFCPHHQTSVKGMGPK